MRSIRTFQAFVVPLVLLCGGCFAPRTTQQGPPANLPAITLSSEQLTSPSGELSTRLPNDWITLDAQQFEEPQIFVIACNPTYTMSVIVSESPIDPALRSRFEKDGERGLVEMSFEKRRRRSNGRATMVGDIEEFVIGPRRFSAYTYTTDSSRTVTRVAVFFTPRNFFECAMTQLTFGSADIPDVATMKYLHQVILGGMEW